jgi:hypothetical protein
MQPLINNQRIPPKKKKNGNDIRSIVKTQIDLIWRLGSKVKSTTSKELEVSLGDRMPIGYGGVLLIGEGHPERFIMI